MTCKELVSIRHTCDLWFFGVWRIGTNYSYMCEELVPILLHVKNWYQFLTHEKNWYQYFTPVRNRYQNLTHVKNIN